MTVQGHLTTSEETDATTKTETSQAFLGYDHTSLLRGWNQSTHIDPDIYRLLEPRLETNALSIHLLNFFIAEGNHV